MQGLLKFSRRAQFFKFDKITGAYIMASDQSTSQAAKVSKKEPCESQDMSKRARKRKRAYAHFDKKFKNAKPFIQDAAGDETSYYFHNGCRKVYPYYHNFKCYVKGRWMGRTIYDVFSTEFATTPGDQLKERIEEGLFTVNGEKVMPDFKLGQSQLVEHICHRHENPVLALPIEIIADTPEVLVINKPPSIPCHPCGHYRYNSLSFILQKEFGYQNLRTLYRLDRLTSGVLIMPKTAETSSRMEKQLREKLFQKEYVTRVMGEFPEGTVVCEEPLDYLWEKKIYIYGVKKDGKESKTTFTRLSYNGETSIVKCIPHTGRTHQIRVHLQFLGYPIVNDPIYNRPAYGPNRGKGGVFDKPMEQIANEVLEVYNCGLSKVGDSPLYLARKAINNFQSRPERHSRENVTDPPEKKSKIDDGADTTICLDKDEQLSNQLKEVDNDLNTNTDVNKETLEKGKTNTQSNNDRESQSTDKKETQSNETEVETKSEIKVDTQSNVEMETQFNVKMKTQSNNEKEAECDEFLDPQVEQPVKEIKTATDSVIDKSREFVETDSTKKRNVLEAYDESKMTVDELCEKCIYAYEDPQPEEQVLYLHALRYSGPGFDYETELPDWAREDWIDNS